MNIHLASLLDNLIPQEVALPDHQGFFSRQDLADCLDLAYGSPLLYSLLSFWTQGESMDKFAAVEPYPRG